MRRLFAVGTLLFCQLSEAQITWSPPITISDTAMDAEDADLGVTPSGYAVAVWETNSMIGSVSRPLGGNWSAPIYVPGTTSANTPKIGIDTNGNAVTVFTDSPPTIRGANLPFNGVWVPTMDLTPVLASVAEPAIGMSPTGNAVATWTAFIPGTNRIQSATLFGFGNITWTSATAELSNSAQNAADSQVAVDASSNAVAVWVWNNGAVNIIQGSTLVSGSNTWVPTTDLTSVQNASKPQVAVTPSGDAIAVWVRFDGANNVIEAARLPFGSGVWSNYGTPLSTVGFNSDNPQVAIDPLGNAVAIWEEIDGGGVDRIRAAALPAAGMTINLFPFLSDPGVNASLPDIAIDPSGTAIATWSFFSTSPSLGVVQASELPLGGNWSTPVTISDIVELSESKVVVDGSGNPVVIWKIFVTGATYQIQAASGLTPNLLSGKIQSCNFGFLKGNSVFLSWDEGLADTAAFRIYRNGTLIATLASNVHNYIDNIVKNNTIQNYILTSVNLSGVEIQIGMISVE